MQYGEKHLLLDDQKKEMRDHVYGDSLAVLKLDESNSIGYTFKALGSGFFGLRKGNDFRQNVIELIMEAGDADR